MRRVRTALAAGLEPPIATAAADSVRPTAGVERTPESPRRGTLRVRLALAAGLTALAVALGFVLTDSPMGVVGTNGVAANFAVTFIRSSGINCQAGGTVPRGTEAIRVSLSANSGPKVGLEVLSGSTLVSSGERAAGWGIDETVTVPITRVARTIGNARICTTVGQMVEPIQVNGSTAQSAGGGRTVLLRMEYLRAGSRSWLALVPSIARDMGLDHAPSGAWVAYLVIAVMVVVMLLASRLVLRELHGGPHASRGGTLLRVPRAAWTCALVAGLSAACWTVITPPFQAPDEPSHFAYAQLLAETGRLPDSSSGKVSQEEVTVVEGLHQQEVEWHPEVHTITSGSAQDQLREDLMLPLNRVGPGGAGVATSEPPLYYALATIPYYLGSSGTLLDSLELMRLLSALMAALTALFVFMFVRECLPGTPWAWTVGGLGAALTPLLGFTSGVVTPEAMLYAVSAAIFFCLARAFRRGLTRRRALAIGALIAVGFLTKLNFIGLAPGVMLGLVLLAFRGIRVAPGGERSQRAFGPMAIAIGIGLLPVCVYVASNALEHHHLLGLVSNGAQQAGNSGSLVTDVGYVWQFYLPRLPGMVNDFPGMSTIRDLWFDRAVGFYGWLDTSFPVWVDNLALIPAALIALLGLRTLLARRAELRRRLPEIVVYLVMIVGLMALLGQDFYMNRTTEGAGWAQPRYLVPLLALAAIWPALAARGAGRRWGPAVGALIVTLFLAQDVFSQMLVVARFYG
jgi:Predicted membrane protein (DUF2142)